MLPATTPSLLRSSSSAPPSSEKDGFPMSIEGTFPNEKISAKQSFRHFFPGILDCQYQATLSTPLSETKFGKRFVIYSFGRLDPRFSDFRRSIAALVVKTAVFLGISAFF